MLKKCTFSILFTMLAMAGMSFAWDESDIDLNIPKDGTGCYLIGTVNQLYGFASIVNGSTAELDPNPTACGKLEKDIVVNENVLGENNANVNSETGEYQGSNASSFRPWVSIGGHKTDFRGTFDGQGHTISGLFLNAGESYSNVGLFGSVAGEPGFNATIKNVGIKDSYFRAGYYVGGVVGYVYGNGSLNIENVFNAAYVVAVNKEMAYGLAGGLVGYVENAAGENLLLNITNAYNTGSIKGKIENLVGGLVGKVNVDVYGYDNGSAVYVNVKNAFNYGDVDGSPIVAPMVHNEDIHFNIQNSFYLAEESDGMGKTAEEFANGSVFALLHSGENGDVWSQNQDDSYSMLFQSADESGVENPAMHVAVLHYSETDSVVSVYTEGAATPLPTADADKNVYIWYDNSNLTGTPYFEIPATATSDLQLYPKKMNLVDGYYEIADADMLFRFADLVNNQNATYASAKVKLTADIVVNQNVLGTDNANVNADGSYNNAQAASAFRVWTPIGNSTNKFQGAFNGKGHTISGLYFNNPETDNVGLFGYTSGAVTIDSVGVVDSYFRGDEYVGSIVGQAALAGKKLTVIRSYNKGVVTGTSNVGGLVGKNGNVQFSYNTGSVTGTSNVGGLVGSNTSAFKINGSYNIGLVKKGTGAGNSVLGYGCPKGSQTGAVQNVYYLEGAGDECSGAYSMTSYEFADGFVAITLHSDNSITVAGADIWGQVVGTDETPLLTGEIVFPITLDDSDNCYEISNADDLYIFAAIVNSGFKSDACGKLTENIVVNENVLTSAGELNTAPEGGFKEWTPIGFGKNSFGQDISFRGTFHGQGHTISGLYFNDTDAEDVGLFGDVNGTVTIDSVGLVDSYIMAGSYVGGLVGFARGSLTISNSYNASSVTSYDTFGGLVGAAGSGSSLAISNSYNVGSLNGGGFGGGLVGYADALAVSNSYNAGPIYNSDELKALVGGITSSVDDASTVTNSFNYGTISYPSNIEVVVDDLVAEGGEGEVTVTNSYFIGESGFVGDGAMKKSEAEFADGTVFALLRNAEDGEVWRQYKNDAYPTFAAKTGTDAPSPMHVATLHYSETDSVVIAYTEGSALTLPTTLSDGSIVVGWYKSDDLSGDAYTKIAATENGDLAFYAKVMKLDSDGYYEVADADMLFKFAELVNTQNSTYRSAKVKLTADIVVNENVLTTASGTSNVNANGEYIGDDSDFRVWTPIGGYTDNSQMSFEGTFDGQGHTISGLFLNRPITKDSNYSALFGIVGGEEVSIKNVGIEDSYFAAQRYVGGIVGLSVADMLKIENCYNDATLYGINGIAGLVGELNNANLSLTVENSYNSGTIKYDLPPDASTSGAGALVGDAGNHANVINSYYLVQEGVESEFGSAASSDAFANGTVATLLHGNGVDADSLWGQNVTGGESHPTFFKGINVEDGPGVIYNGSFSSITVTLHYSEDDADTSKFEHVVGIIEKLPATDKNGNFVLGWYKNATFADEKYAEVSYTENADLDFYAKIMKVVDGCYQIADAEMLFEFAAIVNGGESSACGKLTADIEVNKNVLATVGGVSNVNTTTGAYTGDTTGLREWTPIGYCDENLNCLPFTGIFDGQGHTISGLYFNDSEAPSVGLFGYVEGDGATVSISNVGVEDSYFKAYADVGGIVGGVDGDVTLNIENVYNAATVVVDGSGYGDVGGIVGEVYNGPTLNVTNAYNVGTIIGDKVGGLIGDASNDTRTTSVTVNNSYNYGSVACSIDECDQGALVGSVADADVSVTNSYYLGDAAQGDYGTVKSVTEFANGTVFAALRGADESGSWYQYQGDAYPSLSTKSGTPIHAVTLAFSETDVQYIPYVQGVATSLPTEDKDGNAIIGWTTSADGTGDVITEIPASATTDLKLYAKVETFKPNAEGYYEIASADDLYKFAEIVNGGNSTAKAKLMNDIVVNENVLATAGGESNVNATTGEYTGTTTGLREWTPINNFNGEFDGDGFSISGLYYNGSENGVGLFGYLLKNGKNVSIKNVGVEDSYFKGNSSVGGILGRVEEGSTVNIENVYNAAFVVAEGSYAGGIVGYDYGNKMSVTNAYNIGQVLALSQQGYAGGIVGRNYSDVESFIKNSYNYGSVSASTNRGEIVGYVDGTTLSVANSYYLADHTGDDGARPASDFENGTVLAALRSGEGGYVWVQAEGDKYPTIDINASKNANTIVLDWTNAADSTTLVAAGYTDSAMVIVKDGKKFYANGAIYEGILSADQVAAIGDDMLHPVSGIKLATVNNELVATVNADSDEPLMIPTDVEVSEVVYERVLTKGVYATIMVPFSVPVSSVNGFSFYKFKRVGQTNEGKWAVYVSTVKDSLRANTPYIIVASKNATQISFKLDDYLTLNTTSDVYETTNGNWTMKGVYERKDFLKGDPELGKAYGFAGDTTQVNTRIGRFVRAGDSSYVLPMGVYLVYEEPKMLARPGQMGSSFARINVMPENISVEIEDEEETTVVKHITVAPTFVKSSDRWFDMKGRSLGEKPTAKGTYYHNGQRVIIK